MIIYSLRPLAWYMDWIYWGVKAKHRFINRSLRLLAAELLSNGIVFPLKKITHVARPDGSNFMSFPSGHTNQAFVSATFMHKELGYLSPWYSIGAYTTATAVGMLRMMNNRHWLSDVLVGAGVGILSTNIVYLVFPEGNSRTKPDKTSDLIIVPSYNQGKCRLSYADDTKMKFCFNYSTKIILRWLLTFFSYNCLLA